MKVQGRVILHAPAEEVAARMGSWSGRLNQVQAGRAASPAGREPAISR